MIQKKNIETIKYQVQYLHLFFFIIYNHPYSIRIKYIASRIKTYKQAITNKLVDKTPFNNTATRT